MHGRESKQLGGISLNKKYNIMYSIFSLLDKYAKSDRSLSTSFFGTIRATQNNKKDTCDYGSKEVSHHFYDSWSKEVNRYFLFNSTDVNQNN
jgi:hypothetical protein